MVLAYKHRVLAYKHRVEARKDQVCFMASSLYKAATHDLSLLGKSNAGEHYYGGSLSVTLSQDSNSGIKNSGVHYHDLMRLIFMQVTCGLWTLSCDFVRHSFMKR